MARRTTDLNTDQRRLVLGQNIVKTTLLYCRATLKATFVSDALQRACYAITMQPLEAKRYGLIEQALKARFHVVDNGGVSLGQRLLNKQNLHKNTPIMMQLMS